MVLKFYPGVKYSHFKVNIMTGFKTFGSAVRLSKLAIQTGSIFEPELFPAAIYRFWDNKKHVALIFANGYVTMVGPKTQGEMDLRFETLGTVLQGFFVKQL